MYFALLTVPLLGGITARIGKYIALVPQSTPAPAVPSTPALAVSNPTGRQSTAFCGLATEYSKPAADQALVPVTAAGGGIAAASRSMSGTMLGLVTSVECDRECLVLVQLPRLWLRWSNHT